MTKIAATPLDLTGSFLTHSINASSSGFLKNWKEAGKIVVWLHPTAIAWSVWNHTWYRHVKEHDEETGKDYNIVIPQRLLCLEDEKLLKKQTWREDSGKRTMPPKICPLDFCIEWMYQEIMAGRLEWSTPVFKFESESPIPDDNQDVILYAGGFTGLFGKEDKTRAEKAQLNKVGVKESEHYLQKGAARMQYVFTVASAEDLDAGWLVAMEAPTLGAKLRKEIAAEIKRRDGDKEMGHPSTNPYPFEWTYDENKDFSDKYEVVAKSYTKPSPEVLQLLKEEPPSLEHLTQPPKLGTLYKSMKANAQIKMPFDQFFEVASEVFGMEEDDAEEGEQEAPKGRVHNVKSEEAEEETEGTDEEQSDEDDADMLTEDGEVEDVASTCDVCNNEIGDDDMVCPHCGAVYGTDDAGDIILDSRPCMNCDEKKVPVEDDTATCPQCKSIHTLDSEGVWGVKVPDPPKPTSSTPARRRGGKSGGPAKHSDARESKRSQARRVAGK